MPKTLTNFWFIMVFSIHFWITMFCALFLSLFPRCISRDVWLSSASQSIGCVLKSKIKKFINFINTLLQIAGAQNPDGWSYLSLSCCKLWEFNSLSRHPPPKKTIGTWINSIFETMTFAKVHGYTYLAIDPGGGWGWSQLLLSHLIMSWSHFPQGGLSWNVSRGARQTVLKMTIQGTHNWDADFRP